MTSPASETQSLIEQWEDQYDAATLKDDWTSVRVCDLHIVARALSAAKAERVAVAENIEAWASAINVMVIKQSPILSVLMEMRAYAKTLAEGK